MIRILRATFSPSSRPLRWIYIMVVSSCRWPGVPGDLQQLKASPRHVGQPQVTERVRGESRQISLRGQRGDDLVPGPGAEAGT